MNVSRQRDTGTRRQSKQTPRAVAGGQGGRASEVRRTQGAGAGAGRELSLKEGGQEQMACPRRLVSS